MIKVAELQEKYDNGTITRLEELTLRVGSVLLMSDSRITDLVVTLVAIFSNNSLSDDQSVIDFVLSSILEYASRLPHPDGEAFISDLLLRVIAISENLK